ncbi:VOC family protein [Zooshikella harenae]|uniref:VOC family protein n=1 Tax=Zooshikella harenae TaxID=2827238 RepID=A0ABS5ZLC5_9GAMM|nr:VOC family protein [Zooshikella harenae]MBU2714196.1 VOC family protein [Zooshikella harenae]
MHKSKLAGFIIDCNTSDLRSAADFWSQALGMELNEFPKEEGEKYIRLQDPNKKLNIEVQKVDHPSRVHLDIETDDVAAEVKRLEALGAKRVESVGTWCVMQAPTGQKFCVVRSASSDFNQIANKWS